MKVKISNQKKPRKENVIIGTHSGIFHPDEVVAVAILCLYNEDKKIKIIRSRDIVELQKCDILVDIGEGEFDHHQPGGNGKRDNGVPYASCGLVWRKLGEEVIRKIYFSTEGLKIKDDFEMYKLLRKKIDLEIISRVDAEDNGKYWENEGVNLENNNIFSYIKTFVPAWYSFNEYDKAFKQALKITMKILEQVIRAKIEDYCADEKINELCQYEYDAEPDIEPYFFQNILELPNEKIPWVNAVLDINEKNDTEYIDFVIFPCLDGGWAAQCVPPSANQKFEQRVSFPEEWAGQTTKLAEISGVEDAICCHNERFLVRAKSKESVKKLCVIATEKSRRS